MPLPKYIVRLTAEERTGLDDRICTGQRAASIILHTRILLKADVGEGGPGWDDAWIAEVRRPHVTVIEQRTVVDFACAGP